MHLNRKRRTRPNILSLACLVIFVITDMSWLSQAVQAQDELSKSNILITASRTDEVAPRLELSSRNQNRLERFDAGTIVIFDLRRCPLRFESLSSRQKNRLHARHGEDVASLYEEAVSVEISTFLQSSKDLFPELGFAIRGFPRVGDRLTMKTDHHELLEIVDAFVPSATSEAEASQALAFLDPIASGKPIITGFDSVDGGSREIDSGTDEINESPLNPSTIAEIVGDLTSGQAIALLQSNWGDGPSVWDLNNDGSVSGIDLAVLVNYFSHHVAEDDSVDEADQSDGESNESDAGDSNEESDDPGEQDDQSEVDDIKTLIPGSGFSGPLDDPGIQGSSQSPGFGAKAIARWTELPYITRSEDFHVTVSAFHMSDIRHVDFFLDGGQRIRARELTDHPVSGYAEYMARIDVSLLTTGLHEVRAIAYPYHGEPRLLQGEYVPGGADLHDVNNGNCSFWFQYDPAPNVVTVGGSHGQFQTIDEAIQSMGPAIYGGRIELAPGTHYWLSQTHGSFLNTDERKVLTVGSASDVSRDAVILRSSGSVGFGKGMSVHIKGVTVLTEETPEGGRHNLFQGSSARDNRIFFEDLEVSSIDQDYGWGLLNGHQRLAKPVTEWRLGCWIKDVDFTNIAKGINGVTMAKNVAFYRLSADAFGASPGVIVDLHVDKADPYNANHTQHCDIIQFTGANGPNVENRVFADITATNQYAQVGHLNGHPMRNFAFVRWSVDSKYRSQTLNWMQPMDHVVVDSCVFKNTRIYFGSTVSHLLVRNTYMNKLAPSDMDVAEVFQLGTCVFENFRIGESHSLPGASSGAVDFVMESAPAGTVSDGSDGFLKTILSNTDNPVYSPLDGNMDIERRGEMTNHFYYEASAYDFGWSE